MKQPHRSFRARRMVRLPAATGLALALLGLHATGMVRAQAAGEVYPIDLPAVLRLAGAQNLDVQMAQQALNEARANRTSTLQKFVPMLSPAISSTRHEGATQAADGTILDVEKRSFTAGVTLSAQLPLGEAIFSALQSRQLVDAAEAGLRAQEQDSLLTAVQEYFELLRAEAQIGVVREALAASSNYEQQLGEAVKTGIAFRGDELRVRTQTQRLQIEEQQAIEQQRIAGARLVRTLHLDPLVTLKPTDSEPLPLAITDVGTPLATLIEQAHMNREELARSAAQVGAATEARRGAVYGPMIPSLTAQAFGGQFGIDAGSAASSRDYYLGIGWRFGPGGLFDLGRVRASNSKLAMAELADQKLRDEVARQVIEAGTHASSAQQQLRLAERTLESATETLRLTRERKQLGVGTVLEDIQAQQELLRARTLHVGAITELNKAQYGLMRATGSSLQTGTR